MIATAAADQASAKRAMVSAAVLGKPWVQPKKVNQGEYRARVAATRLVELQLARSTGEFG